MTGWLEALTRHHEAHLWHAAPDEIADERLLEAYRALLVPAEIERNLRYVFERGRRDDLVTRALVRTTLSLYLPHIPPLAWTFAVGPFGRPEISGPPAALAARLRFNLSHTNGAIVCLVAVERDIGVDVEAVTRSFSGIEIADRYFSPSEVTALRSVPPSAQHSRFFDYWTLKEAYIKARGLGLQLPLDQFSFHLDSAGRDEREMAAREPIRISFGPSIQDDPASWQFGRMDLTPQHRLATAIHRRPDQPDLAIRHWRVVPLASAPTGP